MPPKTLDERLDTLEVAVYDLVRAQREFDDLIKKQEEERKAIHRKLDETESAVKRARSEIKKHVEIRT